MVFAVTSQPSSMTTTIYNTTSSGGGASITWVSVSSNTAMSASYGYFVTQGGSQIVMTLPTSATNGATVIIECVPSATPPSVSGVKIQSSSPQTITLGSQISTAGASISSTYVGAAVALVYNSALNTWVAGDTTGNFFIN